MLEPTLFASLETQVQDRVHHLHATAAEVRPRRPQRASPDSGVVARTRLTIGRFLVSLGGQVAGQPHG